MRRLVLTVAVALVVAGCGSSAPSAQQQIRNVVDHYTVDIGQRDYPAACKLATGSALSDCQSFPDIAKLQAECQGEGTNTTSVLGQECATFQASQISIGNFTGLTISKVVVSGSTATVAFNASNEVMTLARKDGRWLIAAA